LKIFPKVVKCRRVFEKLNRRRPDSGPDPAVNRPAGLPTTKQRHVQAATGEQHFVQRIVHLPCLKLAGNHLTA
jgi:hypothetical protein